VSGDAGALVPAQPEASLVATQESVSGRPPAPEPWPYRRRFMFVYGLLAVSLTAAVAGIVVFANRSINAPPAWSAWRPGGGGLGEARQIADHISPAYRLPSGKQLVDVITRAPSISPPGSQTIPVHYLAVRGTNGSRDQIFGVSSSDSIMFSLCGLGPSCSIATGTASIARGRLVRREILELALYTFKYVGGIKNVIAFIPPRPGAAPQYVVYLRKEDLAQQLHVPLAQTLRPKTPLPNSITASEVKVVDGTTETRVFSFSLAQAQQGDAILVLAPLPA
jgi:hypothetical protein